MIAIFFSEPTLCPTTDAIERLAVCQRRDAVVTTDARPDYVVDLTRLRLRLSPPLSYGASLGARCRCSVPLPFCSSHSTVPSVPELGRCLVYPYSCSRSVHVRSPTTCPTRCSCSTPPVHPVIRYSFSKRIATPPLVTYILSSRTAIFPSSSLHDPTFDHLP